MILGKRKNYILNFMMFDVLYWIQLIIFRSLTYLLRSILAVYYWGKSKTVPPIRNPLLLKSATDIAQDIRNGEVKSGEVVQAYIDRILEVEPYVNAVVQDRFEEALKEAADVDELLKSDTFSEEQLKENKPLLGVPVTIKVLLKVKGTRCTAGNKLFKDVVAEEDAPCVALIKKAGGIILATTNSPEFGLALETHNLLYGKTCNPYDTCRTPGGSSGGESALLAAGASAVGIGNDMVGSVRVPAHFSGIYAHKPTRDLISNKGTFPIPAPGLLDYISTGPMCRFVEDLGLMMKVLTAENKERVTFDEKVDFKRLKIFYTTMNRDPRVLPVDREIVQGIHKAISHFTSTYGASAQELKLPLYDKTNDIAAHLLQTPVGENTESLAAQASVELNTFTELYNILVGNSNFTLGSIIFLNLLKCPLFAKKQNIPHFQDALKKLTEEFDSLLDEDSVFICPTFPQTAPYHYEMIFFLNVSCCFTSVCNFTGLPGTALPMGFNRNGMPQGMQIIGKKNNDPLTIACAVELKKVFGGWIPPGKR